MSAVGRCHICTERAALTFEHIPPRRVFNDRPAVCHTFFGLEIGTKFNKAPPVSRFNGRLIDDGFTDLARDAQGRAVVSMKGKSQKISITLGPKFRTILVYSTPAPPTQISPGVPGGTGWRCSSSRCRARSGMGTPMTLPCPASKSAARMGRYVT